MFYSCLQLYTLTSLFLETWKSYSEPFTLILPHFSLITSSRWSPPALFLLCSCETKLSNGLLISFQELSSPTYYFLLLLLFIAQYYESHLFHSPNISPQAEICLLYFLLEAFPENLLFSYALPPYPQNSSLHSFRQMEIIHLFLFPCYMPLK